MGSRHLRQVPGETEEEVSYVQVGTYTCDFCGKQSEGSRDDYPRRWAKVTLVLRHSPRDKERFPADWYHACEECLGGFQMTDATRKVKILPKLLELVGLPQLFQKEKS